MAAVLAVVAAGLPCSSAVCFQTGHISRTDAVGRELVHFQGTCGHDIVESVTKPVTRYEAARAGLDDEGED